MASYNLAKATDGPWNSSALCVKREVDGIYVIIPPFSDAPATRVFSFNHMPKPPKFAGEHETEARQGEGREKADGELRTLQRPLPTDRQPPTHTF